MCLVCCASWLRFVACSMMVLRRCCVRIAVNVWLCLVGVVCLGCVVWLCRALVATCSVVSFANLRRLGDDDYNGDDDYDDGDDGSIFLSWAVSSVAFRSRHFVCFVRNQLHIMLETCCVHNVTCVESEVFPHVGGLAHAWYSSTKRRKYGLAPLP